MMNKFIQFRHEMHQFPELSGCEFETSKRIKDFMQQFSPDKVIQIGKTSLLFVFNGLNKGQTTVFRADMDALPIQEKNNLSYVSENKGVAHLCGHDGHTSILLALAEKIAKQRPQKGKIALLFQAAEETGQGALEIVESSVFKTLSPDYVFGLHNIPGFTKHRILLRNGSFASASKGMVVRLYGKTAHAAEPEKGINPAMALSQIIANANHLVQNKTLFSNLTLLTVVHIRLGEIAFGTSAGYAEIRLTLRAYENADMDTLDSELRKTIAQICKTEQLTFDVTYTEVFPATKNHEQAVHLIENSLKKTPLRYQQLEKPFRWSEDFGHYLQHTQGAFFGLGAGENQPALHNPDYNFPDELIETGATAFFSVAREINY